MIMMVKTPGSQMGSPAAAHCINMDTYTDIYPILVAGRVPTLTHLAAKDCFEDGLLFVVIRLRPRRRRQLRFSNFLKFVTPFPAHFAKDGEVVVHARAQNESFCSESEQGDWCAQVVVSRFSLCVFRMSLPKTLF